MKSNICHSGTVVSESVAEEQRAGQLVRAASLSLPSVECGGDVLDGHTTSLHLPAGAMPNIEEEEESEVQGEEVP